MTTSVKIDGDFVVFSITVYDGPNATHFEYDIPVSDLQTTTSVTKWCNHLAEKKWGTPDVIDGFKKMVDQYWRNR